MRGEAKKAPGTSAASGAGSDQPTTASPPAAVRDLGGRAEAPVLVRGLVKHFRHFRALDGLDLEVEAGSVHGFLGPNGAGKSTRSVSCWALPARRRKRESAGPRAVADRPRSSTGRSPMFPVMWRCGRP